MISFELIDFLSILTLIVTVYLIFWCLCLGASLFVDNSDAPDVTAVIWKYGKLILNWLVYAYVALSMIMIYVYGFQNVPAPK
jgi:hypothetical protein